MRIWIIILLSFLCLENHKEITKKKQENIILQENFNNILPDYFFDKGAWFGLKLSEKKIGLDKALILSDSLGYKSQKPLLNFIIKQNEKTTNFIISNNFTPGKLVQKGTSPNLNITLKSIFINKHTALISCRIENKTTESLKLNLQIETISDKISSGKKLMHKLSNSKLVYLFETEEKQSKDGIFSFKLILPPKKSCNKDVTISHYFDTEKLDNDFNFNKTKLAFDSNRKRWNNYLIRYKNLSQQKQFIAAKCIQTLINNWRSPSGLYKHDGLYPSYYYSYFNGFWAWDSWKHAVALSLFEPQIAKEQIKVMFDFQNEKGMVADAIWRDSTIYKPNLRNTKPPLAAWAIYSIFKADNDSSFVKKMFPKLLKYHQWWYKNRDHNNNQLCEYGSTDGSREAAAWESGMDNAVRFDSAKMLKNNDSAWSLNQESVDLNAYLYNEKIYLIKLGKILNKKKFITKTNLELKQLKDKIINTFYNDKEGYLYDFNIETHEQIKVKGPEAWTALWAKILTKQQAEKVINTIVSPIHFNTYFPFPSLDASHPKFSPTEGYWRGPVWIDQAYIAITGMKNYGFNSEAEVIKEKLMNNMKGLAEKKEAIWENYNPINGKPLNAKHFSWSASSILLLLNEDISCENEI